MFKITATCAAVLVAGQGWASTQCDPAEAEGILEHAQASGIVAGMSMLNGIPSISVEGEVWAAIDLETRLSIISTFECAVAGRGNILAEVQVIAETGKILASFDGLTRQLTTNN